MNELLIDGVYFHPRRPRGAFGRGRAGAFLDRDGVVIDLVEYLHRAEDVRLAPGAAETIAALNAAGVPVIVVTNQSGIGRGYYDWAAFEAAQAEVDRQLATGGATLDAVVACPFFADGVPPYRHADHPARKPNPGMVRLAAEWFEMDTARSWLVGDSVSDIETAARAGMAGAIHVATGYGARDRAAVLAKTYGLLRVECRADLGDCLQLLGATLVRG